MSNKPNSKSDLDHSKVYQFRVKGCLDSEWSDWFDNLTITPEEDGTTLLTGPVVDDAALYGLLKVVRDSGMQLISVNYIDSHQSDVEEGEQ